MRSVMLSSSAVALASAEPGAYARARELAHSDPVRFHEIAVWLLIHACFAAGFVIAAFVADRRFRKPLGWLYAALGTSAVFVVFVVNLVAHSAHGEGGLGAMDWFFGMVIGIPFAIITAMITAWWLVGKLGVPSTVWAALCAVAYIPLITSYALDNW